MPPTTTSGNRLLSTLGLSSSLIASLTRAGYETINDLAGTSDVELASELGLNQKLPQELLNHLPGGSSSKTNEDIFLVPAHPAPTAIPAAQLLSHSLASIPATQIPIRIASASALARPQIYQTPSTKLNALLSGAPPVLRGGLASQGGTTDLGLRSLSILEVCGPPGSGRASIALEFIRDAVMKGQTVLVADTGSSLNPARIQAAFKSDDDLADDASQRVLHTRVSSLVHVIAFLRTLPEYLEANAGVRLLVLSNLSFVFQATPSLVLTNTERNRVFGMVKEALTLACMKNGVTVIITSSTKIDRNDGSGSTTNPGVRGVLASQLGEAMFTSSRSSRVMLSRDSAGVRHAHLMSAPDLFVNSTRNSTNGPSSSQGGSSRRSSYNRETRRIPFLINDQGRVRDA